MKMTKFGILILQVTGTVIFVPSHLLFSFIDPMGAEYFYFYRVFLQ